MKLVVTVMCKSNANTCRRNLAKFLAFRRILDRNETDFFTLKQNHTVILLLIKKFISKSHVIVIGVSTLFSVMTQFR